MEATLLRRNRLAGALTVIGFASAFALTVLWLTGLLHANEASSWIASAFSCSIVPAAAWFEYYGAKRSGGTVHAAAGLLRAKDERGESCMAPKTGHIARLRDGRWRVDVGLSWLDRFRMEVASEQDARDILRGLGLDQREGTTRFRVNASGLEGMPFASTITVGVDGIGWSGRGTKLFIPHSQIRSVKRIEPAPPVVVSPGVVVALVDGRVLELDTRKERFDAENWVEDPVYDAIVAARSKMTGEASASATLARGQRTTAEWLQAIREVGEGNTNYRVAAIDEQALETVLADAGAPVDARAAAAVALRVRAPARLRIAIEDVADEDVRRIALAEGEDVERELAALTKTRI